MPTKEMALDIFRPKTLVVVGAGTAGIQGVCHYLAYLASHGWIITLIHSPKINILGIGESTNPPFVEALEDGANFNILDDTEKLDATLKFGTHYVNWRSNPFTIPVLTGYAALHINTFKLKDFALPRLKSIWGDKFQIIEGTVSVLENVDESVHVVVDDKDYYFDYAVDNRGFPDSYDDYNVIEDNPVNHALIHNTPGKLELNATLHQATPDGWMFGVPLTSRTSYGYLFNDKLTTIDKAKVNFSKEINVPVEELNNIEYKFKSYYSKKVLDKRIIKNGNRAVFFEPMFANSLWLYKNIDKAFVSYMKGFFTEEKTNEIFNSISQDVEDLICYFYHGGSIYNTEFWQHVKPYASKKLETSRSFSVMKGLMRRQYKFKQFDPTVNEYSWVFTEKHMFIIDEKLGYHYFSTPDENN
jgi:tryptophan 7-halogenase